MTTVADRCVTSLVTNTATLPWQPAALDYGYDGEVAGPEHGVSATGDYFNYRKASIYAGSNEIQRNIISKMMLGL